jgi:hypothetical protein
MKAYLITFFIGSLFGFIGCYLLSRQEKKRVEKEFKARLDNVKKALKEAGNENITGDVDTNTGFFTE